MSITDAYNDPLQDAREQALRSPDGLKAQLLEELQRLYAEVIAYVVRSSKPVEEALEEALQELSTQATAIIETARRRGQAQETEGHKEGFAAAAGLAGLSMSWDPSPQPSAATRGVTRSTPQLVRGSISQGISYFKQDLKYIRKYVTEDEYAQAVAQVLSRGNEDVTRRLARRGINLGDIDLSDVQARAPQVFSNLKQTGVTELADIMDETGKELAAISPAVDLTKWVLSSRHSGLASSPDVCDVLATQDVHGYGPGLYHTRYCPSHPHPNCECRMQTVLKHPDDWGDEDRPAPDKPDISDLRSTLEQMEGDRTITDDYSAAQQRELQRVVDFVHDNPRGV